MFHQFVFSLEKQMCAEHQQVNGRTCQNKGISHPCLILYCYSSCGQYAKSMISGVFLFFYELLLSTTGIYHRCKKKKKRYRVTGTITPDH